VLAAVAISCEAFSGGCLQRNYQKAGLYQSLIYFDFSYQLNPETR